MRNPTASALGAVPVVVGSGGQAILAVDYGDPATYGIPTKVPNVNSSSMDLGPEMSGDGEPQPATRYRMLERIWRRQ